MNENTMQKCRTCLRSSAKTVHLTGHATGCNPRRTYGQLLKEYANLKCSADYECFMPQYLCLPCTHQLRNSYQFIKQAQCCNNKLINVISKQLECLLERTIDLPENESDLNDLEKNLEIKEERTDECHIPERDELSFNVLNKVEPKNIKATDLNNDIENILEIIDIDENVDDLPLQCSPTIEKEEILHNIKINTDKTQTDSVCPICEQILSSRDDLIKHVRIKHDIENPSKFFHKTKLEGTVPLECSTTADNNKIINETQTDSFYPICETNLRNHDNLLKNLRIQHDVENPNKNFHKPKVGKNEVFSCKFCSAEYTKQHNYLYHLKHKHYSSQTKEKEMQDNKIIKCNLCNYIAGTHASLSYHKRAKHGTEKDKYKCNFCSNMYFQKFILFKHMKNCHKEEIKTLKAEEGPKTDTTTDNNIINRQRNDSLSTESSNSETEEEEKEQCSDEEFIRNILNIKRRQTKLTRKPLAIRCDECGNIYKDHMSLYAHQKYVHISQDKYIPCPHCDKKYKRKAGLKVHMENKHVKKTNISKTSSEITKQPPKAKEKLFMCTECSYVCSTIAILNVHVIRHHAGERPYKCDICFKSFIVKYDLKIHRYLHTGERPYKCPICSKGFRDKYQVVKHKRIHNSERPYKCKECNKSFTLPYNLSVHRRTHLKAKKLNCIVCGKVFENRLLLNLHRINENHHDEDV